MEKSDILDKFSGKSHKWLADSLDTYLAEKVILKIDESVKSGLIKSRSAKSLINSFKDQEKFWIKFIKTVGRKNFYCLCQIIDAENNKIEIELTPQELMNSHVLSGTPKSLKLYSKNKKDKGIWNKSNDDGFIDPIQYPPAEEELTELGYEMYKEWELEIQNSGMSREEYKKKLFNTSVIYKCKAW